MSVIKEKKKAKPLGLKKIFLRLLVAAVSGLFLGLVMVGVLYYYKEDIKTILRTTGQQTIVIGGNKENAGESGNTSAPVIHDADVQAWQMSLYQKGEEVSGALVMAGDNNECDGIVIAFGADNLIVLVADCPVVSSIKVRFSDGLVVTGDVIGRDKATGLAVVFVEKKHVRPVTLMEIKEVQWGSTQDFAAGQYVIAVGRATGERKTVIVGCAVDFSKSVTMIDREYPLLETNIPARTNASGFLLDESGELIGVVTHRTDKQGEVNWITVYDIQGITDMVELLANKKPIPYLGIDGITVTDKMNRDYGVPDGVYVNQTVAGSPAMQGNVQAGDVIVGIDGVTIHSMQELQEQLLTKNPGDEVVLMIYRMINGKYAEMTLQVAIGTDKIESR